MPGLNLYSSLAAVLFASVQVPARFFSIVSLIDFAQMFRVLASKLCNKRLQFLPERSISCCGTVARQDLVWSGSLTWAASQHSWLSFDIFRIRVQREKADISCHYDLQQCCVTTLL